MKLRMFLASGVGEADAVTRNAWPPALAQMLTVISVNTTGGLVTQSSQPVMIELISLFALCEKQETIFYLTNFNN